VDYPYWACFSVFSPTFAHRKPITCTRTVSAAALQHSHRTMWARTRTLKKERKRGRFTRAFPIHGTHSSNSARGCLRLPCSTSSTTRAARVGPNLCGWFLLLGRESAGEMIWTFWDERATLAAQRGPSSLLHLGVDPLLACTRTSSSWTPVGVGIESFVSAIFRLYVASSELCCRSAGEDHEVYCDHPSFPSRSPPVTSCK
jgi:hypothetical protein